MGALVLFACVLFRLVQANADLKEIIGSQKKQLKSYDTELKAKMEEIKLQNKKLEELKEILTHVKLQDGHKTPELPKQDNKKRLGEWDGYCHCILSQLVHVLAVLFLPIPSPYCAC